MILNRMRLFAGLFGMFIALIALFAPNASAQMNIEIKGVGQSLYPVAISRFKDEIGRAHV